MAAAPELQMRVLTLRNPEGVKVNELAATVGGRRKTFHFPYTTNDQQEIDFLLSVGARPHPPVARSERAPMKPSNEEPLKGGEEK